MGLKIAMVSSWATKCGIYTYTRDLASALAQEDVEVYIVRIPRFGIRNNEIFRDIAERIPVDKIDLIHISHEYGLYQGCDVFFYNCLKQLGKPIITTMHGVGYNTEIDDKIAEVSSKVIVHNKFCKSKVNYPNTVIIPHGASPSSIIPRDQAKKAIGVDPSVPLVGYLGFITPYKGIESIIQAMTKVENAGLLVAGGWHLDKETDYINKLKEASLKVLPNRVKWLGFIPDEQLSIIYSAMDILVYPSKFATESGALITALSHGKAVITSALPAFLEKEESGALVTACNMDDLVEKIKFLLNDNEARHKLEEAAMKYAESTSWTKVAQQHIELYKEVLAAVKKPIDNPVPPT